ncbi:hypothetical protein C0J52_24447 [Blattella germanica]|nr:hypothetical protein C0J52_24447 [Blattella germanica]
MAKKWKAYPWADRGGEDKAPPPPSTDATSTEDNDDDEEEEIDVVGESPASNVLPPPGNPSPCWGPSSPTAGATAPSPPPPPPPHATATAATPDYNSGANNRVTVLYNGELNLSLIITNLP